VRPPHDWLDGRAEQYSIDDVAAVHAEDHEIGAPLIGDAKNFVVGLADDDDLLDVERQFREPR
jgi:hypothetical protein